VASDPYFVAIGDFNGDGKPDLVVADYLYDTVGVLLNTGNGAFAAPVTYAVGQSPWALAVGDFNGDGHLDLVVANANDNTVSVLINQCSP